MLANFFPTDVVFPVLDHLWHVYSYDRTCTHIFKIRCHSITLILIFSPCSLTLMPSTISPFSSTTTPFIAFAIFFNSALLGSFFVLTSSGLFFSSHSVSLSSSYCHSLHWECGLKSINATIFMLSSPVTPYTGSVD
jgi:hypothetical protein